jgi:nucleoside-diphosphate-sugar epimerase
MHSFMLAHHARRPIVPFVVRPSGPTAVATEAGPAGHQAVLAHLAPQRRLDRIAAPRSQEERLFRLRGGTSEKGVAMKVFVAGATGALGKQLVPLLVARGHDVVGMTRSASKRDQLRELGATPVVADALDAAAVREAVGAAQPDVVVHQLTAIPPAIDMRRIDRELALTNRLRTEGTDNLLSAGRAFGVKRFVAQSNAAVPYARRGGPIKREDDPFDPDPPAPMRATIAALLQLEQAVTSARWTDGVVLRYGWF